MSDDFSRGASPHAPVSGGVLAGLPAVDMVTWSLGQWNLAMVTSAVDAIVDGRELSGCDGLCLDLAELFAVEQNWPLAQRKVLRCSVEAEVVALVVSDELRFFHCHAELLQRPSYFISGLCRRSGIVGFFTTGDCFTYVLDPQVLLDSNRKYTGARP